MFDGFSDVPMPFKEAKHNYTKNDLEMLNAGGSIGFTPTYGNKNPVYSTVKRIK